MAVVTTDNIVRNIHKIVDLPHNQSVYQLVRGRNKDVEPNTLTLVSTATNQSYTWHEFWSQVDNVSQQLLQRGFQEGQVMAIFSPNCPEYLITLFAVWKAGGTVACVSPLWKSDEVSRFFRLVVPKWVLTTPDLAPMILAMNGDFQVQVRCLQLVPAVLMQLRSSPRTLNYDLSHVEDVTFGSSTIGSAVVETVMNRFPKSTRTQGYAMTETAGGGAISSGEKAAVSIGVPMPGLEMKVIDVKSGQALGPNQRGEICIRSPTLMSGYVGNPRATKEAIDSDHWLHTGDMGYFDNDGYFYFVERLKELIKYSSYQVAPAELEALLLTHRAVAEAGVFGKPDSVKGELPTAWVVLKDQYVGVTTQTEIVNFVAEQVAHYKKLRGGVRFVSNIPKSDSGKIQRRKMRDLTNIANSKL